MILCLNPGNSKNIFYEKLPFSLNLLILPCLFALSNFGNASTATQQNEQFSCRLPAPSSLNGQATSSTTADLSWSSGE